MSNVWGSGGLFEKALANKLENQSMHTETERMNAINNYDLGSTKNANEYDLGLRGANNQAFKNFADYDLGLRGNNVNLMNANTNQANADTNRFGAETDRLAKSGPSLISDTVANNLGLRSYNPVSQQAVTEFGNKFGGANLMAPPSQPGVAATTSALDKMKQPGYKKGGKVAKMACAKGGKIGDVEEDEGEDTIDAKVRPGEYMLNPETVAHIGGGNYDKGVRNLNAIVREATGKEPGPTPVGKSDKVGFANSGPNWSDWVKNPSVEATEGSGIFSKAAKTVESVLDTPVDELVRKGAEIAGKYGSKAVDLAKSATVSPVGKLASKLATPVMMGLEANETFNTPTAEFYRRTGIDPEATVVPQLAKDIGVRALGTLQNIGNTVTFGLADGVGNALAGNGFTQSDQYKSKAPVPAAASAQTEAQPTAESPAADKNTKASPEAEQPSLRDMMMNRLQNIDRVAATNGGLGSAYWDNARGETVKALTELDKEGVQDAKSAAAAKLAHQKDVDDRINERNQIPIFDKDGNITGYKYNPNAATEVRNQLAEQGVDIYSQDRADVDDRLRDLDAGYRGLRNFNESITKERGSNAIISNHPRDLIVKKGISLSDTWADKNGLSLGDWLDAKMSGNDDVGNMQVIDPITGQSVAASKVFRTPDGRAVDADAMRAHVTRYKGK